MGTWIDMACNWIIDNKEWFFSGAGVFIISCIVSFIIYIFCKRKNSATMRQINNNGSSGTQIGTQNNYGDKGDG